MNRLELIDRLSGEGALSGGSVEPFRVRYDISVNQWVLDTSGDRGAYDIEAYIEVLGTSVAAVRSLYCQGAVDATLSLADGRRAQLVILNTGDFLGGSSSGRLHCRVNHMDGYT